GLCGGGAGGAHTRAIVSSSGRRLLGALAVISSLLLVGAAADPGGPQPARTAAVVEQVELHLLLRWRPRRSGRRHRSRAPPLTRHRQRPTGVSGVSNADTPPQGPAPPHPH